MNHSYVFKGNPYKILKSWLPILRKKPLVQGKQFFKCIGGELHGVSLRLNTPSTVTFSLNGCTGRYCAKKKGSNLIHWIES